MMVTIRYGRATQAALLAALLAVMLVLGISRAAKAEYPPDEVEVGMFVSSVYDLDFYDGTFSTIFWVWFIFEDPTYDPIEAIEVTNARRYRVMESYGRDRSDGRHYVAAKLEAVINQPWDITHFPFDSQRLEIILESVGKDASQLVFDVDAENTVVAPSLHLSGWRDQPIQSEKMVFRYNTTFGEESPELVAFPRVKFTIPLRRDNPKLFFEVYIGYFIAFLMCGAIWLTAVSGMPDYRIGMILAATFAAIGNKNVLESNYPSSPNLGLSDHMEASTFVLITVSLIIAVGAERFHLAGRDGLAAKLNHYGFPIILLAYMGYFAISVWDAVQG
jgi:hypothetical protein